MEPLPQEDSEAQRGEARCPRSHSKSLSVPASQALPTPSELQPHPLAPWSLETVCVLQPIIPEETQVASQSQDLGPGPLKQSWPEKGAHWGFRFQPTCSVTLGRSRSLSEPEHPSV